MKYILGLTGPTGSGKSSLCRAAEREGWQVIDCDKLARTATDSPEVLKALTYVFGEDILDPRGKLIRAKLAQKAFSTKENTELLNNTILPFIVELIKTQIAESECDKIILDAPTLFESGADSLCSDTCAVLSDKKTRLVRIISRDGITEEAAKLRISAGKPDRYYKGKTRHIIYNNGDEQNCVSAFLKLLSQLGGK